MKALNQTERNNLFLKFFLLFILTVGITVFAIFYDFVLPQELNEKQRRKLALYNDFQRNQKKMIALVDTLNQQIEDLDNGNKDVTVEKERITRQIRFKSTETDTAKNSIYTKLEDTYIQYLSVKAKLIETRNELDKLKIYMEQDEKQDEKTQKFLKEQADANKID